VREHHEEAELERPLAGLTARVRLQQDHVVLGEGDAKNVWGIFEFFLLNIF
jgi:hypothetical protein